MKKIGFKKRGLLVLAIIVICLLTITGTLSIIGVVGSNANLRYARSLDEIPTRNLSLEKDGLGYWTFTNEADTNFKILQLTDIHIGAGFMTINKDRWALDAVRTLVEHTKPDLIIVTGDMVYPVPVQAGTNNNRRSTELFGTLMDSFGIPWTVTYGNHDEEWYAKYDLEDLNKIYSSYKYSLFQSGPEDIYGQCNTFINIKNADGALNTSLALIDSNAYEPGLKLNVYDKIHDDQVEWYEEQLFAIKEYYELNELMPSLAFFHIPVNEYEDAWKLYREGSDQVIYHFGQAGEKNEGIYPPATRGKIFDKMVELGSTKAIFCGHDHLNDFSVTYKGIRLTYGKSIDYLAYYNIKNSHWQRGGTVIEIAPDSSFTIDQVVLADIA